MFKIDASGFKTAKKRLNSGIDKPLKKAIFVTGNFLETQAKKNIKKKVYNGGGWRKTGKAQQSIAMIKRGNGVVVSVGVDYGKYIEKGTGIYHTPGRRKPYFANIPGVGVRYMKGMKPRPFWKPAVKATRRVADSILQKEIEKHFNNL